jgi:hypothetical protein
VEPLRGKSRRRTPWQSAERYPIVDREADDYALFAALVERRHRFVVRGDDNRVLELTAGAPVAGGAVWILTSPRQAAEGYSGGWVSRRAVAYARCVATCPNPK